MSRKTIEVRFHGRKVGLLADAGRGKTAFSYDEGWLKDGFSISPFSLPLKEGVFLPQKDTFNGLFGVFSDSLPDAWGQLLVARMLKTRKIPQDDFGVLDRLAVVGESGMGALTYHPAWPRQQDTAADNLDRLARECSQVLHSEKVENLDKLFVLGASSGGARPKIMTRIDEKEWIIKFPAHVDPAEIGRIEKAYSDCAEACGILVPETKLFPSDCCSGYFGSVRFDRLRDEYGRMIRRHMLTASALLEIDFRVPSLDYHSLMKLTAILCRGSREQLWQMYRRMCFNVYAHNQDDHSKNFTYLYDEKSDTWTLSPAYDLTYSSTYYGEHTTSVNGNGRNPGLADLCAVGQQAGLSKDKCRQVAEEIREKTADILKMGQSMAARSI